MRSRYVDVEDGYMVSFYFRFFDYDFYYVPIFRFLTCFFEVINSRRVFNGVAAVCGGSETTLPYESSLCSVYVEYDYFYGIVLVYGVFIEVGSGVFRERYRVHYYVYVFMCVVYF